MTRPVRRGLVAIAVLIAIVLVFALAAGPRNLTDEQIARVAANGGVIGIGFWDATTVPFDASGLNQVTAALVDAGFTEQGIRLIMGENVVRLLGQALPKGGQAP
jgi:microsomal dipeptidase-like Zn-dependent dipeptidase